MTLGPIGQIALPVSDADRAQHFYGETLGLRLLYRFGKLVFFDCAGLRLMLEGSVGAVPQATGVCIYFKIKGIEDRFAELSGKGIVFVDQPHRIAKMPDHDLWMVFFRDPDGHLLALMEEKR
jgi:methylmalonyl-CoA/ethylmalonyl-CoA epimerase